MALKRVVIENTAIGIRDENGDLQPMQMVSASDGTTMTIQQVAAAAAAAVLIAPRTSNPTDRDSGDALEEGDYYYNTDRDTMLWYDGTNWTQAMVILDEDDMASNDDTKIASQQSIKAYVDAKAAAQNEASEITLNAVGNLASTDVQAGLEELQDNIDTLNADDTTNGSVDKKVKALADGAVQDNTDDITTLNANAATAGSVSNAIKTQVLDNIIDEDDMASDSDTKIPTQQSVKKYVDDNVAAHDTAAEITLTASGNLASTNVQDGLDELQGDIDTLNADDTTAGSVDKKIKDLVLDEDDMASDSAVKVPSQQSTKKYIDDQIALHDTAAEVTSTASGNLAATNVQDALDELQGDIDTLNADSATAGSVDKKIADVMIDEDDMASDSAAKVPTQQSVKAYVDGKVAGGVTYKGAYDAGANSPDLDDTPAAGTIKLGDMYTVTVAGTFYTMKVAVGDVLIAEVNDGSAVTDWTVVNRNMDEVRINNALGTTTKIRHDKVLGVLDVIGMEYNGNGKLTTVKYTGDDAGNSIYFRDIMEYNGDGKLIKVRHFNNTAGTADADKSGLTELTYNGDGKLDTSTYTE